MGRRVEDKACDTGGRDTATWCGLSRLGVVEERAAATAVAAMSGGAAVVRERTRTVAVQ